MRIFFFIVIIYCSANLYFYRVLSSLITTGSAVYALGVAVCFMTVMPVLIPVCSNSGSERFARIFSYTGYLWLAFLVIFFPSAVLIDVYNYAIHFINTSLELSSETSFIVSVCLSLLINSYGYFEAKRLKTERIVMKTSKLPEGIKKIRIAQISDLHFGVIVGDRMLEKVIRILDTERPDIIVSTGDLVDGNIRHIRHLADRFRDLRPRLGKFAVLGNHEVYAGIRHSLKFIEEAGFVLLRGNAVTPGNIINIAGMDFLGGEARRHSMNSEQKAEHEILSTLPEGLFTLLLKHKSDVEDESLGLFDLQLSGHTHKGQIFPMSLATMFIFPHHTGFTMLPKGSSIYTSRGTGTAGPPVRFLAPPEITIVDIVPGEEEN